MVQVKFLLIVGVALSKDIDEEMSMDIDEENTMFLLSTPSGIRLPPCDLFLAPSTISGSASIRT